ncbi:LRR receptor-like serine/threonine-protein kinase FLS2 [Asparagus officinalis]|uniref:LRR receptor-like serine/threonine-protein kinase FLS2 n=1 Tax=Asparagus officinalis TaxID=4686 RepID=UPI00098E20A7|nr:LRR receptor-like serine/threonine-protein kinase FLS2 [Asparagus officinalis]
MVAINAVDRLNPHSAAVVVLLTIISLFSFTRAAPHLVSGECLPIERASLLDLKRGFSFDMDSVTNLSSWKPGSNCCKWEGVTCDPNSGHVISLDLHRRGISGKLSGSLFNLTSLQTLDLSDNLFEGSFPQSGFENLAKLTYLDLSNNSFEGSFPQSGFENLTQLTHLDLSGNNFEGSFPQSGFENLTQLTYLDLSSNSFEGSFPQSGFENLTQLTHLDLYLTEFSGQVPIGISHLTNLIFLGIGHDVLQLWNLPSFRTLVGNLTNLRELYLFKVDMSYDQDWSNALSTSLPRLQALALYSCGLSGLLPTDINHFITSHMNLTSLGLSDNPMLSGGMPNFPKKNALQVLSLSATNLSGTLPPDSLANLKHLTDLDLTYCAFSGPIPFSIGNLTQLEYLYLSYNEFTGAIPRSLFELPSLTELNLGHNSFNGTVNLDSFRNLRDLSSLALSGLIVQEVSEKYFHVFPNLTYLTLASCGLTKVPTFLRYQNKIEHLDLSDNKIDGGIPNWIIDQNLSNLNLSNNGFTHLEEPFNLSMRQMGSLDLHSNMLQRPIPLVFPYVYYLDYSNNNISSVIPSNISSSLNQTNSLLIANNSLQGQIPMSICEAHNLQFLDLSQNNLSGPIPSCLFQNNSALIVLKLRGNRLQGTIPLHLNEACKLEALIISDNHLEGPLPRTLLNCTSLKVFDIGNNHIVDTFPFWLGNMINMNVLILRGNALYGQVETMGNHETHEKTFSEVRILDLSSNHFEGNLPSKCFNNLESMKNSSILDHGDKGDSMSSEGVPYEVLINKQEFTLERILTISYTFVDFSNNRFEGSIPEMIGELHGLHKLNLSHNSLIGKIPPSIGNMTQLEQLDISANHLSGEIPQQLTYLNFLSFLNLSNNNLNGRIPQGEQFNTFSNATYLENQGLCGKPLSKQCGNVNPNGTSAAPSIISDHPSPSGYIIGLALFFGLGFGVGLAAVVVLQNVQWKFWKRQNGAHV